MKRRIIYTAFVTLLSGCAATPMKSDVWESRIATEVERIALKTRCCVGLSDLPTVPFPGSKELQFDEKTPIGRVDGTPSPAIRLELRSDDAGNVLEFFSYSDKKRSVLRFGELIFIRPTFTFLDENGSVTQMDKDVKVCYGERDGAGGTWSRAVIPTNVSSVVISSGISRPIALIDTREMYYSPGAVVEAIADSRQSYINELRMGYTGIASIEIVGPETRPRGRCVADQ